MIYALDRADEHVYVGQQLDVFIEAMPADRGTARAIAPENSTAEKGGGNLECLDMTR